MVQKIADQDLLDDLERIKEKIGHRPRACDVKEHGQYSLQPYQSHWGSWSNALNAAGMELDQKPSVSDEELLDELRRLGEELDRTPSTTDIDQFGEFSVSVYQKRFEGVASAREKVGLERDIDTKQRVEFVCSYCGSVEQRTPSEAEKRDYCSSSCANKATFGVESDKILSRLESLAEQLGRAPSAQEFDKLTDYWHGTLGNHFGSYSEAIRQIGLEPRAPKDVSDEELLNDLVKIKSEMGRPPKITDLSDFGRLNTSRPYVSRWGSWASALEAAGIEPNNTQRAKIEKEDLIEDFNKLAAELGRAPSYNEVDQLGEYSTATYERAFGTFLNGKAEAGYEPVACTENLPRGETHYMWKEGKDVRYGKNWLSQRKKAKERDSHECRSCGITAEEHKEKFDMDLHVHHITPAREFEDYRKRNRLSNLMTLCAACHRTWENMPIQPEIIGGEL